MTDFNHIDEQIAELEKQVQEDAMQPKTEKPEKDPAEEEINNVVEKDISPSDVEDNPTDEPSDDDFTSDDEKKRARAFARERQRQKELKEELRKQSEEKQALAERIAKLEGRAEASPKATEHTNLADEEPDADLYPEDHARWELNQVKKELEDIKKFKQQQEQSSTYQREVAGVEALESQFKQNVKDYDEAATFIIEKEKRFKRLLNPQATDAQLNAQIQAEKVALFKQILTTGKNPAELVYEIAKQDGWQPKKVENKKPSLDTLQDNQRKASSIIGGSPADNTGSVTADQIFNMSMDKLTRMSDSGWNELEKKLR
jgi:hypothetical protein